MIIYSLYEEETIMAWYDEAVFYHIYPLGLLGAPKQNEYGQVEHRLRNLEPWIKHIREIGCNAIYIGPLFESVGHGYETTDYKKLDSRLGDNADLKDFVAKCHKNGIRVIFDGVFNHTGRDFFAFKDIKQNRESSAYRDWYCNVNFWGNNEYNDGFSYDNWGGYNLLAKLNQKNPAVRDYICDVIKFWVSEFDVDGIRLDAADVLDFEFMKALRRTAEVVKPEFWLMGEVIHGDYTRWVNEGTLHSVTNYTLHKALYSGHNDHNYFEIAHTVRRLYEMGGNKPNGLKLYNFCDNHDVERIITKLSNKSNFTPVHILMYTLPGVPSIYYGSEYAIEGKKEKGSDDSLRPSINLEDYKDALTNNACTQLVARLGVIRCNSRTLSYGDYKENSLTNRQYVFTRNDAEGTVIVAVNNDEGQANVHAGGIRDGEYVGAFWGGKLTVSGGNFDACLQGNSGEIFVLADSDTAKVLSGKEKTKIVEIKASPVVNDNNDAVKVEKKPTVNNVEVSKTEDAVADTKTDEVANNSEAVTEVAVEASANSASSKYNIGEEYATIDTEVIKNRTDYDSMTIKELQVAILEKMSGNGYIDNQMIRSVMDNEHQGSLLNWVKSFR